MSKAIKEYEVTFANLNLGCVGERIFRAANAEQAVEMAWEKIDHEDDYISMVLDEDGEMVWEGSP